MAIFQKHLASFTILKAHCHTQTFQDDFHFLWVFFFRNTSPSPWLRPKTMSLSASSVHHITLLNTIFDQCLHGRLFCPLPQLRLWPRWLSREPTSRRPHHNYHCFHSVTLPPSSKDLTPPQSLPFPHTISPNCHNQGVSIRFCLLFFFYSFESHVRPQFPVSRSNKKRLVLPHWAIGHAVLTVSVLAEEQLSKKQEVTGSYQQKMEQWRCYFMPLSETHQQSGLSPVYPHDRHTSHIVSANWWLCWKWAHAMGTIYTACNPI